MPFMLQPKNYTQIARPNFYNAAYRRVGAYKGMGRIHPTNYLEIGPRPNRIGATSGQYNTLSGQLSLLPPGLRGFRGLGQGVATSSFSQYAPSFAQLGTNVNTGYATTDTGGIVATSFTPDLPTTTGSGYVINADGSISATSFTPDLPASPIGPYAPGVPAALPTTNYAPWIIGGLLGVVLLMGMRR